jgi:hypothetical protein
MATWGAGILDGEAPLDSLGALADGVLADVLDTRTLPPSEASLGVVAAGVGLLLQLSPFCFERHGKAIGAAIHHHVSVLARLPEDARRVLVHVAEGRVDVLTERDGTRRGPLLEALGGYVDYQAEPSLYAHPAAARYVERFVERCATALDEGLGRTNLDLQALAAPLGALGALLIVRPGSVECPRVERWGRALRSAEAASRASVAAGELGPLEDYLHNARLGFRLAARTGG